MRSDQRRGDRQKPKAGYELCVSGYDYLLEGLLKTTERFGGYIFGEVKSVNRNKLHNLHPILAMSYSEHELLSLQNRNQFVGDLSAVTDGEAHGHLFRCTLQIKPFFERLSGEGGDVRKEGMLERKKM